MNDFHCYVLPFKKKGLVTKMFGDCTCCWSFVLSVTFFFRKMVGEYRFAVEQQGLQVPISCCALVVFS